DADRVEHVRDEPADEAHGFEVGKPGGENSEPFDQIAADGEYEEHPDERAVFEARVSPPESVGSGDVSAVDSHPETDHEQKAERVHHQRVGEIKVADEERLLLAE